MSLEMPENWVEFSLDDASKPMKHFVMRCLFRRSPSIAQATMTTLSLFLFAATISYSESDASGATKPFLVFEHTESPDGRYAVAWGLPKHPDIWTKVCEFEREHPAGLELNDEDPKQARGVFDDVAAVTWVPNKRVVPCSAEHRISALLPIQNVVPCSADEKIISRAAIESEVDCTR